MTVRRTRTGAIAASILGAAVLAGCSIDPGGRDGDGGAEPSPTSTEIPCDASIGRHEPDEAGWTIVDEAVALPSTERPALQAIEVDALADEALPGESWWWAKHGISVRGTSRVELQVPPEHLDELRIGWGGGPAMPVVSVIADCEPPVDSWLAFAGGYWAREPGCYPLEVRVDEGPAREVHVGIGAPCPGQEPPGPVPE